MLPHEAGVWVVSDYLEDWDQYRNYPASDLAFRVTNSAELHNFGNDARHAWEREHGAWPVGDIRLPPGAPRPKVMLPAAHYAPDFVNTSMYYMVSARLRYAMALPDTACQFLPIELIDGSDLAYEQDYRWMAYLASEDVLDMLQSDYDLGRERDTMLPGEKRLPRSVGDIRRFVVHDGFQPASDLFRMAGRTSVMLGTELLARRVERAGCTGVSFVEVESQLQPGVAARDREDLQC